MKIIISLVVLLGIMNIGKCQIDIGHAVELDAKNNILIFQSEDHVRLVADDLERQHTANERNKNAPAPEISDQAADASSEQGTKNGQEALAAFEESLRFRSLRAILQAKVDQWLKEDGENLKTEPADSHIVGVVHRTLLNEFFEIKVGKVYHKLSPSGNVQFATLDELLRARADAGVTLTSSPLRKLQPALCRTFVFNQGYKYCNDNRRRVKYIIGHYWFLGYIATTTTLCHSKGLFGWWWPVNCYNEAKVYGSVSAPAYIGNGQWDYNQCKTPQAFNTAGWYTYGWWFWVTQNYGVISRTKSGWVKGRHYSACCPGYFYTALYF